MARFQQIQNANLTILFLFCFCAWQQAANQKRSTTSNERYPLSRPLSESFWPSLAHTRKARSKARRFLPPLAAFIRESACALLARSPPHPRAAAARRPPSLYLTTVDGQLCVVEIIDDVKQRAIDVRTFVANHDLPFN